MTTGLAVVNHLKQHFVTQRVKNTSDRLMVGLKKIQQDFPVVSEIRGQGLLQFIRIQSLESDDPALGSFTCCQLLRELGVITTLAGGSPSWLKLTPALTISDEEIDIFISRLRIACTDLEDYL
jgi:4-aminobutyrate aminotransferase-like enzyme